MEEERKSENINNHAHNGLRMWNEVLKYCYTNYHVNYCLGIMVSTEASIKIFHSRKTWNLFQIFQDFQTALFEVSGKVRYLGKFQTETELWSIKNKTPNMCCGLRSRAFPELIERRKDSVHLLFFFFLRQKINHYLL